MDITKDTPVDKIVEMCPETVEILNKYSLPAFICGEPVWDTLESVCKQKNINVETVINELNQLCK